MSEDKKKIWSTLGKLDPHQPFIDMKGKERRKPGEEYEYFMETQYVYEFPDGQEMCEEDSVVLVLEEIEFGRLDVRAEFYFIIKEIFRKFQKMAFPLFAANGKKYTAYCWETGQGYYFGSGDMVEIILKK